MIRRGFSALFRSVKPRLLHGSLFGCQSFSSGCGIVGLVLKCDSGNPPFLGNVGTCGFQQIRGRKRSLKRPLSNQERAERRKKREEKIAAKARYSHMERIMMHRMTSLQSISMQGPGRYDPTIKLPDKPFCNLYFRDEVKTQFYTVAEVLEKHRLIQQPAIYGNVNAPLLLRIELNMTTEKASKMVSDSTELVAIPHPFEHKEKRTVLALVEGKELQEEAVLAGADISLGKDAIKKILKGQFMIDDYDFCVAHVNMASEISPLRGILRSRFPTGINGAIGDDLTLIIKNFLDGVKIVIKGDPINSSWGITAPIVGRLNMPDEHVEANIEAVITATCRHRNPALGPFINRAVLMTIPGESFFAIDTSHWHPEPTESQIKLIERRKKKKKAKDSEADDATKIVISETGKQIVDPRITDPLFDVM